MVRHFRLELANPKTAVMYGGLDFHVHTKAGGVDPVLQETCGEEMDYGPLLAYLFRRFGYPNHGWDEYKELACYLLTTPRPDLILRVVPYVGGSTRVHFSFLAPSAVVMAVENWGQRFRDAWKRRALEHQEAIGMPEWMPEWISFCNNKAPVHFNVTDHATVASWNDTLPWLASLECTKLPQAFVAMVKRALAFRKQIRVNYEAIEPYPDYSERSTDWHEWEADDPLQPLAAAAAVALQDLRRPVRVRDCAIDAFGPANERYSDSVKEPAVAGYPSGDLGNRAPEAFAELQGLILRVGNGSAIRGIRKVMKVLCSPGALLNS